MEANKEDPHIKNILLESMGEFKDGMIEKIALKQVHYHI